MSTLTDFLLARIAEDEAVANNVAVLRYHPERGYPAYQGIPARVLAECEAKRRIIAFHEQWPVLIHTEPTFEPTLGADLGAMDQMVVSVSQQMAWVTMREYVARFGEEPPTTPMLRALAAVYADHLDYRAEWATS